MLVIFADYIKQTFYCFGKQDTEAINQTPEWAIKFFLLNQAPLQPENTCIM